MTTGIDVGKTRLDDLDRQIIRDSLREPFDQKTIVNIGCGESSVSMALGVLGHRIYNYDQRPLHDFFAMEAARGHKQQFSQITLEDAKLHLFPKEIDVVIAQRVLHYLCYQDAQRVMQMLVSRMREGGLMYMSLSGIESHMAAGYDAKQPIEKRWQQLVESKRDVFNAHEPLCLYSEGDARELIGSVSGLEVLDIWVSKFGNVKIICKKVV